MAQYAQRDPIEMDLLGGHFSRNMEAMTAEGLREKADIAAELGWRDMQIAWLKTTLDAVVIENESLRSKSSSLRDAALSLDQNWQQYAINSELVFMYLTGNEQVQRQLTDWRYKEAREKSIAARKKIDELRAAVVASEVARSATDDDAESQGSESKG